MSPKATKKTRAVELAGQFIPTRLIALEMGVSTRTVQRWLAEYRADLPPLARLIRERLQMAASESRDIDLFLRVASIARHYQEAQGKDGLSQARERYVDALLGVEENAAH